VIKLFHPYISWWAIWKVLKVLIPGKQLAEGPLVKQFEKEFSKKFNVSNVIAVNSGTSALELAYELAEIKKGDEVITPVLTCTATNIPLIRREAKIVFADITKNLNIDIEDVKKKITKKTKAIIFVHFGGNNIGLKDILQIARSKNIKVIEDAAQAIGSSYWGKADFTAISFQAIKTLTTGDGGMLICKNKKDYEKAKRLRWFGYDREKKHQLGDIDLKEAGYKYHMNDITAAIGLGNLRSIDKVLDHRNKLAKIYASYGFLVLRWLICGFTDNLSSTGQFYASRGIEIGQHHYRNDKYMVFGGKRENLSMMNKIENNYFFVPYHHKVSEKQAHYIGKLYKKIHESINKK